MKSVGMVEAKKMAYIKLKVCQTNLMMFCSELNIEFCIIS